MIQPLLVFSDWGILALRLALGLILVVHGWPKIKNLRGTAGNFETMGFKPGIFWGTIVALLEFVGGLFVLAGLFTQLVSLFVALEFLIILLKLKRGSSFAGGYEFDLLILASALSLAMLGSGAFSLDQFF